MNRPETGTYESISIDTNKLQPRKDDNFDSSPWMQEGGVQSKAFLNYLSFKISFGDMTSK